MIGPDLPAERVGQRRGDGKRIQQFSSGAGIDPDATAGRARGTARIDELLNVLVPQLIEFSCCCHFPRHIRCRVMRSFRLPARAHAGSLHGATPDFAPVGPPVRGDGAQATAESSARLALTSLRPALRRSLHRARRLPRLRGRLLGHRSKTRSTVQPAAVNDRYSSSFVLRSSEGSTRLPVRAQVSTLSRSSMTRLG